MRPDKGASSSRSPASTKSTATQCNPPDSVSAGAAKVQAFSRRLVAGNGAAGGFLHDEHPCQDAMQPEVHRMYRMEVASLLVWRRVCSASQQREAASQASANPCGKRALLSRCVWCVAFGRYRSPSPRWCTSCQRTEGWRALGRGARVQSQGEEAGERSNGEGGIRRGSMLLFFLFQ